MLILQHRWNLVSAENLFLFLFSVLHVLLTNGQWLMALWPAPCIQSSCIATWKQMQTTKSKKMQKTENKKSKGCVALNKKISRSEKVALLLYYIPWVVFHSKMVKIVLTFYLVFRKVRRMNQCLVYLHVYGLQGFGLAC